MGAFIAKQPNGLYCRFSSIVDTVTEYNMTEDEYVKMRMEEAREDALNTLKHYVRPFEMVIQNFEPVNQIGRAHV